MPQLTIPPELKIVGPFLQRAEETRQQNPIVSYWCTYYALQIALGIKFDKKDNARTMYLANLMDFLEREKQRLAPNEAISQGAVSSVYVENFALRVFASADSEDRKGTASRNTAKKFLAAANFLELLKIFDPLSQDIQEKIRYSKWKAADISKAFREGRNPQPGPPGGEDAALSTISPPPSSLSPLSHPHSPPGSKTPSPRVPAVNLPASPPSSSSTLTAHVSDAPPIPPTSSHGLVTPKGTPINPGLWSNHATPGGEFDDASPIKRPSLAGRRVKYSQDDDSWSHAADMGSRQNSYENPFVKIEEVRHPEGPVDDTSSSSPLSTAFVPPSNGSSQPIEKHVRWTPSVTGGSSTTGSPPDSPEHYHPTLGSLRETDPEDLEDRDPTPSELDKFDVSQEHMPGIYGGHPEMHPSVPPVSPPAVIRQLPRVLERVSVPPPPPPPSAPAPVQLTDAVIAKIQKHCRFAISSLDYEDVEQARKELRTALALLGGNS